MQTGKAVKRTVRWPASDVIWCHCVLNTKMKAFLNRQSFVRNIFSGEPLVNLSDFAFQDEYDVARDQDEGTLLSFTDMLKHARRVEEHRIEGKLLLLLLTPLRTTTLSHTRKIN